MAPNKRLRKQIEDELFSGEYSFLNEGTEENIVLNKELENDTSSAFEDPAPFLKSDTFPADSFLSSKTYGGKPVSRKSLQSLETDTDNSESSDESVYEDVQDSDAVQDLDDASDDDITRSHIGSEVEEQSEIEDDISVSEQDGDISASEQEQDSEIEDDISESQNEELPFLKDLKQKASQDIQRGETVLYQLSLCEMLLETRIKLQKVLMLANRLPKPELFKHYASQIEIETGDENPLMMVQQKISGIVEEMLKVQNLMRRNCPEYVQMIKEKGKNGDTETEEDKNEEPNDEVPTKKMKLADYSSALHQCFTEYIPFRNPVIRKWSEKTKIASGKLTKSNFSAFDQPVLKQIEQIMADKLRLIKRTQLKRSQYDIIGEMSQNTHTPVELKDQDNYDTEIFDDDDFYHKLLREYIEKRTVDITDPTQLGKKWIELQKLRIKMKRKVDTRSTKGRKLRYDVHPKLVNFMAPIENDTWNYNAATELFNSLFGNSVA